MPKKPKKDKKPKKPKKPKRGRKPNDAYEVKVNPGAIVIPIKGNATKNRVVYDEKAKGERQIVIEDEDGGRFTLTTRFEPADE